MCKQTSNCLQSSILQEEQLTKLVEEISNEKNTLEIEMKKLNVQIESHQTIANDDLKSLIRDLRKKKSDAEREAMVARHKLTLTGMENEKVMAQISTRDSQISEMRDEMKQLQEVVNEQLVELQNIRCTTERSSVSTLTGKLIPFCIAKIQNNQINEKLQFFKRKICTCVCM